MGLEVKAFESTPNPNAIKAVVDGVTGDRVRSYFTAEQAAGDALGEALFAIPGVSNVLIHTGFVTVCKVAGAGWGPIKAGVKRALREHG